MNIFLLIVLISMLVVFGVDLRQKRRSYLDKQHD